MSQDKIKKLACAKCKKTNYSTTRRIKGENLEKLKLNKFCKHCRTHSTHNELKK